MDRNRHTSIVVIVLEILDSVPETPHTTAPTIAGAAGLDLLRIRTTFRVTVIISVVLTRLPVLLPNDAVTLPSPTLPSPKTILTILEITFTTKNRAVTLGTQHFRATIF